MSEVELVAPPNRPDYSEMGEAALRLACEADSPMERSIFLRRAIEHFLMANLPRMVRICEESLARDTVLGRRRGLAASHSPVALPPFPDNLKPRPATGYGVDQNHRRDAKARGAPKQPIGRRDETI